MKIVSSSFWGRAGFRRCGDVGVPCKMASKTLAGVGGTPAGIRGQGRQDRVGNRLGEMIEDHFGQIRRTGFELLHHLGQPGQRLSLRQRCQGLEISYHGHPEPGSSITSPDWVGRVGWFHNPDGSITTVNEPNGAAFWFPVNDHPRDKATYTFRVTVAKPYAVAANGLLAQTRDNGDTRTYVWETASPLASYHF